MQVIKKPELGGLKRFGTVAGSVGAMLGLYFLMADRGIVPQPASSARVTAVELAHNEDIALYAPRIDAMWSDRLCDACVENCQAGCELGGGSCTRKQCKTQCRIDGEC